MDRQHLFIIKGNSMDNGIYSEAIRDGSAVIGHEIMLDKVRQGRTNYVIVHTSCVSINRVRHYNFKTGELTCNYINPDKDLYPDFTINISNDVKIYRITHFTKHPIALPPKYDLNFTHSLQMTNGIRN